MILSEKGGGGERTSASIVVSCVVLPVCVYVEIEERPLCVTSKATLTS